MSNRMAELAKQEYEKTSLIESGEGVNYKKHLETCAKNRKKRKKKKR